jgi:hypothetical protein
MICYISTIVNNCFTVRSDNKAKGYEFDTRKAACIERANLIKYMKGIPNMKIRFEAKVA